MNPRRLQLCAGALLVCLHVSLLPVGLIAEAFELAAPCCESGCCLLAGGEAGACLMRNRDGKAEPCTALRSCSLRSSDIPVGPTSAALETLGSSLRPGIFANRVEATPSPTRRPIVNLQAAFPIPPSLEVAVPPPERL